VAKLEGSIGDVTDTLEVVKRRTDKLDLIKEQLRDYVTEALSANRDVMKKAVKGELTICKATLGNGMLASTPKHPRMDVPKSKKFKGTRSARYVDNFL
ncbi:hypothetical protein Gorai_024212, partial [Gossypium raimondii]|nr:hypothetical protein [Gossypium raimondii]